MKAMNAMLRTISSLLVLVFCASTLWSQVATGTYPYGTFDKKGFDTINVGNLNAHFGIPIINKSGRGIPFRFNLGYDSSVWSPVTTNGINSWVPSQNWGWADETQVPLGYLSYSTTKSVITINEGRVVVTQTCSTYLHWVYFDPYGGVHPFPLADTQNCTPPGSKSPTTTAVAVDGSGYSLSVSNYTAGTVTNASGQQFVPPVGTANGTEYDSNGNEISVNPSGQFTDTTGKVALTVAGTGTPSSPTTFTYTGTNGNAETVTMNYTTYMVQTAFGCSGISEFGPTAEPLVSSIVFPDGSSYSFSYEATPSHSGNVTGRLAGVQLRQGGTIQYVYETGANQPIECADGSAAGLTRTMNSDSGSATSSETYVRTITGTGTSSTAVVDGLGNGKNYTFVEASNQPAPVTAQYYETSRQINQGRGVAPGCMGVNCTPLLVRNTCYNGAASPCTTTAPTLPITQVDTWKTLNGIETDGRTAKYNANGMRTEADVYDFGASSRGALLRKEVWTYGYSVPSAVTQDEVFDGSGNVAANTVYAYDGTAVTTSSGVPQHVATGGARGNLTSMTQYVNGSTAYTTTATYEDTGSLLTSTVHGATTAYSYDPTFVYRTGTSLPTPSSGVALSSSTSFDTANTGLPLSSTDANGQVTKIPSYDAMLRPTEVEYPDGGETIYSYSPTLTTANVPAISATTETEYDGYGRTSRTATVNGQGGYYQQDICYDANGNAAFKSYPYSGSGFGAAKVCSGGGDAYTYDVLGRVTGVTRSNGEKRSITYLGRAKEYVDENGVTRISQVDGLGRLTTACEISSNTLQGASPATCGTDISGTGYVTTYSHALASHTTTILQGAQTRVFQHDWLKRPILVQEPESGTTTYGYAYNSTGLVTTRTKPQANQTGSATTTTTTQYDSLGRVVGVSYSDGTPAKNFGYDAPTTQTFWNISQTNLKGRLSMAIIGNVVLGTNIFAYDPMGRISWMGEYPPTNCGCRAWGLYYTYDLAGDMTSSTDGNGVISTYTYSPAGEILSLTSSQTDATDPTAILAGVQNGPFGPVSYSLGNGLTGMYSYDVLGRLSGGTVSSGGTQIYGFADGWKGKLVTGSSDSVLNQGSAYGYDEFNRLASLTVNAGTGANYGWAYDRYGNRVQQNITGGTGSGSTFTASVNPANNQLTGYMYDAVGNMTNDGFHKYTYDAEGHVTAVDGGQTATYVYNALNQRVSASVGGATIVYVYNAAGQRVSEWNGANPTSSPIQGKYYWGAKPVAYYANGSTHFEHQDWLGTERMRTTYNGQVEGTFTSLPFGDGQATAGADTDANHYAMLDHDTTSDTDYAQYRQYANMQGRWLSPDPYHGSYKMRNPQSFNRYVYASNNPLARVDHLGLDDIIDGEGGDVGGGGGDWGDGGGSDGSSPGGNFNWDPPTLDLTETLIDTLDQTVGIEDLSADVTDPDATVTTVQLDGSITLQTQTPGTTNPEQGVLPSGLNALSGLSIDDQLLYTNPYPDAKSLNIDDYSGNTTSVPCHYSLTGMGMDAGAIFTPPPLDVVTFGLGIYYDAQGYAHGC